MTDLFFSLIIPVYNRPDEVDELLQSLVEQEFDRPFEVVLVEDGSTIPCEEVAGKYSDRLQLSYYFKANSGPGDSRNFGMQKAKGDYFLIFDSDCIIPPSYLQEVDKGLKTHYVDCFGGPDKALDSFSDIQKAINFAMTSFLTTGGIRGGSEKIGKFQPRSFNMGISRKAFEASGGFGSIHPGEDPDLSIRLWKLGFETHLFTSAYVYHKRRIDWSKFYKQVTKFGKARPILNSWYPEHSKLTFFFPTVFMLGLVLALLLCLVGFCWGMVLYLFYFLAIFVTASVETNSIQIGLYSLIAVCVQFYGYGFGFLHSYISVQLLGKDPKQVFPELFFRK